MLDPSWEFVEKYYLDNQQIILQNYNYYDENSHKN